jgi:jumonji domain-containing protein 7
MYAVIRGEKIFELFPPTDAFFLPRRTYPKAQWVRDSSSPSGFKLIDHPDETPVPWINYHPPETREEILNMHLDDLKRLGYCKPLIVSVRAGEVLYLPSLWYHRVSQVGDPYDHACIAVNYWYDMKFDMKFVYYQFVEAASLYWEKHFTSKSASQHLVAPNTNNEFKKSEEGDG